tara:strand:- start:445 stop:1326 length:882 start_codon:yes stop_codon:yes gene_type:complete
MRFKIGHKLKPHEVKKNGVVLFTDGTRTDLLANQFTCEAYGYHFIDGVCCAFTPSPELMENKNVNTFINNGHNNEPKVAHSTIVNGSHHSVQQSYGCLVTGENHTIAPLTPNDDADAKEFYVNNSSIIGGSHGHVSQSGQVVIGGGGGDGNTKGQHQVVFYTLSGTTTGATDVTLYIQGDTNRAEEITLPANSISLFELNLTGLCTGGTSGTPGHYKSLHQVGTFAVTSVEAGNVYDAGTTTTTASSGNTGTPSIVTTTAGVLGIKVRGLANVTCTWFAVVKLFINKTTQATF